MNHKQQQTLHQLFQHPINSNLKWPEVISLLHALGNVTVESHDRFLAEIDGHHEVFRPPHHTDLSADDIFKVRRFLEQAERQPVKGASPDEPARGGI